MTLEDFCPVGECVVCTEHPDEPEAGHCAKCGGVFCWGDCGEWEDEEHTCSNCSKKDGV